MSEPNLSKALEILERGLSSLGISPTHEHLRLFSLYLAELKKWNRACNLTSVRDDAAIVVTHFLDSLLYLGPLPAGFFRAADVGSGAGFPGIPIKIARPEAEIYLIEPSGKKCVFLRHLVAQMRMEAVRVIEKRIEDVSVPEDAGERVDAAMTRALYDVRTFVRKSSHIVKPGGMFILNKGPKVDEELKRTRDVDYLLIRRTLPTTDIVRNIVVVTARGTAGSSLPAD